jgi:hypothetical protein
MKEIFMKAESLKLSLIERLMRVQNTSALQRMNELITQAEMEIVAEESLQSISKGEVLSLDEFSKENRKWAKKNLIN